MLKDYQIRQIMFEEKNNFVDGKLFGEYADTFEQFKDRETNEWNLFGAFVDDLSDDEILISINEYLGEEDEENLNFDDVVLFRKFVDSEVSKVLRQAYN